MIATNYKALKTMTYSISSTQGADYGEWEGDSKSEALLKLHREGYGKDVVWLEAGEIHFKNDDYERLIGDVTDWHVEPIE